MEENKNENVEELNVTETPVVEQPVEAPIEQPVEVPVEQPEIPAVEQPTNLEQPAMPEMAPVVEQPAPEVNSMPESNPGDMEPIVDDKPKSKKGVIIGCVIGCLVLVGLIVGVLVPNVLLSKKNIINQGIATVFKGARKTLDVADKNMLKYNLDSDVLGLEGSVSFDSDYKNAEVDLTKLKNYKITYNGVIDKKGNRAVAGVKLDGSKNILSLNAMMKEKNVYINLGDLFGKTIVTQTEQEIKDLEISSITVGDIELLVNKTETVLKENTKDENITKEKVEKEINGKKGSYQKVSYKVDVNDYAKKLLEAYKADEEVIDVLARLSNQKESDIKELLNQALDSLKDAEKEEMTVNIYLEGLMAKTKEIEIISGEESIIIDKDNDIYKYRLTESNKDLVTGSYDSKKQEFTMNYDESGVKFDVTLTVTGDNSMKGNVTIKSGEMNATVDYDMTTKLTKTTEESTVKATVNYQEGSEKINFSVNSNTKVTVGAKVEELDTSNVVPADQISDENMTALYGQLMSKLEPVLKDIVPSYSTASFKKELA